MNHPPSIESITEKVRAIFDENIEVEGEIRHNVPLMRDLGLDSLDMIEFSFSLEEFFEFQFGEKNAMNELDKAVGGILEEGKLTPLGRKVLLERAPELAHVALPETLTPTSLQEYFTLESFVRIIREFYIAAPDVCPQTGDPVVLDQFKIINRNTREPVEIPTGDMILETWLNETATSLGAVRSKP